MEVYIENIVVTSQLMAKNKEDLQKKFQQMKEHNLKMNPPKCAFGVSAKNFLGFLVHERGIKVDKNKTIKTMAVKVKA